MLTETSNTKKDATKTSRVKSVLGLSDTDVQELVEAYGIPDEHKDAFLLVMDDEEWANCRRIQLAVKYHNNMGFDARAVVAQFYQKADLHPRAADDQPIIVEGMELYEKNDAATDLQFFLNLFLTHGNNISILLFKNNISGVLRAMINRKCAAYGIETNSRQNRRISSCHLTLDRLAKAFPVPTCTMIMAKGLAGNLKSKLFISPLPLLMQHSVFVGMIPDNDTAISVELRKIALILNLEMSIILSTPKQKRKKSFATVEDMIEESEKYVDAAMRMQITDNNSRVRVLIKAGILTKGHGNAVTVSTATQALITELAAISQLKKKTYAAACMARLENV